MFVVMEKYIIKGLIQDRMSRLNDEWARQVDEEDRSTPMDYIRTASIQGAINELADLLMEIDRTQDVD